MGQKRKHESSDFFEAWAKYKVNALSIIVSDVDDTENYEKDGVPGFDWKNDCSPVWFATYSSWDDFVSARRKEIEAFMETGKLKFDPLPFIDIIDGPSMSEVIKKDCSDLINIIENSSHVKDKISFLDSIETTISIIASTWENSIGRYDLRWEQKEGKKNSGIGQIRAQKERQAKLVESLRQYVNDDQDEIKIKKSDFCKLLDQTFVGSEDYPRHPSTIQTYRMAAERILGKKIILQRK